MNENELQFINEWLESNQIKKCPDSYEISKYTMASVPMPQFPNQKSCIPKDISWKEKDSKC